MYFTMPKHLAMLHKYSKDVLFKDEFFEDRECKNLGTEIRAVKPVLRFTNGEVDLRYNVGTRTNGVDQARWPSDLMTEVVK